MLWQRTVWIYNLQPTSRVPPSPRRFLQFVSGKWGAWWNLCTLNISSKLLRSRLCVTFLLFIVGVKMWLHWWESVADCSLLGITFANCSLWSGSPDGVCTASSFWSIFNWIIAQQQIFAHFLVSENVFLLVCYLPLITTYLCLRISPVQFILASC